MIFLLPLAGISYTFFFIIISIIIIYFIIHIIHLNYYLFQNSYYMIIGISLSFNYVLDCVKNVFLSAF